MKTENLRKKQAGYKIRLLKWMQEIRQLCTDNASRSMVRNALKELEKQFDKVQLLQEELEEGLSLDDLEKEIDEFRTLEQEILEIRSIAEDFIEEMTYGKKAEIVKNGSDVNVSVRLPRHELPKFHGDVLEFTAFWEQFEDCIHTRRDISDSKRISRKTGIAVNSGLHGRARCHLILRSRRIRGGEKAGLQIIRALAHGNGDQRMVVNCLFDTGAERSFVRADVAQELVTVHGFGGGNKELQESMLVHFHLSPLSGGPRQSIEALTTKTLCDDIFQPGISARGWPHLRDLGMADEEEEYLTVHVVIGVDYFFRMLGSTITCLRWVICGPQTASQLPTPTVAADKSADTEWDQLLRKFWELEAIGISSEEEQSPSGLEREEFERNLSFDGVRYTVRLLWERTCSALPNNYSITQKRLSLVHRKLKCDPTRWEEHVAVIQSYLDNGWAEDAPDAGPLGRTWYLPHHAVYQKRYRIGLQVDIQKMYLQVALHVAGRDVCRFLWSEPGENEPPKTYRLTRVCFGLTCSPYLAMQTIRWHAENHQVECSGALSDLFPNMYVDELVGSCDSVADASRIAKEATELLGKGGFHLAKWASNSPAAVDDIPAKDQKPSDRSRLFTTLGVFWQRESDMLTFRPPERVAEFTDTKRGVLKALTSVFDPLGCLAPYTVKAKIIIQLLWQWRIWKEESLNLKTASRSRSLSTCEGFQRDDQQNSEVSDLGRAGLIIVMDHGPSGGSLLETEGIKLDDQHGRGCTVKESDAKGGRSCGCGHRSLYCAM
ncbi:hypothetical protein T4C_5897 [Trichinella pseudospiralis]|uniref:Peptidase A2 domain-containing protein n=1 Tax=Trichinella pseudospiralis TaxID=6337 RepID=A0A0V1JKQ0_TRIPS|nr:hypothetical protein T4C_5897 [Trichinella pseudospiralis]